MEGEVGVAGWGVTGDMVDVALSVSGSVAGRWRTGRLRNAPAARALSEVGEDASGDKRAGDTGEADVGEVGAGLVLDDCGLGLGLGLSLPTTSQPSTDSVVDSEDEIEVEDGRSGSWAYSCSRCRSRSRSFPFNEPKRRFTPKLSLRFRFAPSNKFVVDIGGGLDAAVDVLEVEGGDLCGPRTVASESVTLLAHALGILKNDTLGESGLPGSGECEPRRVRVRAFPGPGWRYGDWPRPRGSGSELV